MLTRKGEVLSWNRGAEILYGYPEEEVLRWSIFDLRLSKGPTVATDRLTARECEVMSLLAEGLSMKEVGVRLDIATKTAGVHAQNFMRKLDLHSRAAVVRWAIAYGLVELP